MATRKNQEIERKREMQSPESKSNNEKQIRAKQEKLYQGKNKLDEVYKEFDTVKNNNDTAHDIYYAEDLVGDLRSYESQNCRNTQEPETAGTGHTNDEF